MISLYFYEKKKIFLIKAGMNSRFKITILEHFNWKIDIETQPVKFFEVKYKIIEFLFTLIYALDFTLYVRWLIHEEFEAICYSKLFYFEVWVKERIAKGMLLKNWLV